MVLQRCDCNVKSLPLQQREHKIQVQTNQMFCCISRFRARVGGTASLTRPPYKRMSLHDGQNMVQNALMESSVISRMHSLTCLDALAS